MILSMHVALFALFGLLFGSFANVVIWRLPRKESLSYPASHCPKCNTPLKPYDNIPVFSYLILGGKCRFCKDPISPRYPVVELMSALLCALAPLLTTNLIQAVICALFLYLLLILSFIDYDTHKLPNNLVGLLGIIGVIGAVISLFQIPASLSYPWAHFAAIPHGALPFFAHTSTSSPLLDALGGVIVTAGPAFLVALLYKVIRKKQGFGMGDIKLLAVIGLFLGLYGALVLPAAAIVGLLVIILTRIGNRKVSLSAQIPFGPFIAFASVGILMFGPQLWSWYLQLLVS